MEVDSPLSIIGLSEFVNPYNSDPSINAQEIENNIVNQLNEMKQEEVIDPVEVYNNIFSNLEDSSIVLPISLASPNTTAQQPTNFINNNNSFDSYRSEFSTNVPLHSQITEEQTEQNYINKLISSRWGDDTSDGDLYDNRLDEYKVTLLEEISDFISDLKTSIDLSTVPNVSYSSPIKEIERVHLILKKKYDRVRFSNIGNDYITFILLGAEFVFNGEREFLGYKPCLKGVHKKIKVKLRRIRYETANVVSRILNDNHLGSISKIMIEILPTLFIHNSLYQETDSQYRLDEQLSSAQDNLRRFDVEQGED